MKIILTGGAGFIGSCLLWKLNQAGVTDIVVVDELGHDEKWKNLVGKSFSDYIEKDIFLERLESGRPVPAVDAVVHLGACSSTTETDASYLAENNFGYSQALCRWALKRKARFLYASSAATYGAGEQGYSDADSRIHSLRPLNMYGFSKHMFDLWVIRQRLTKTVVGLKFFNVFGPNEYHKNDMRSVIAKVYGQLKAGQPMRLFRSYRPEYADGEQRRDFIYVKDAVEMVWFFLTHPAKNGIYNIGTGEARSWNDVARALFASLGRRPDIEYIEMPETIRDKYQYFTEADMAKLRKAGCRHVCMPLEDAVRDYAGYLDNHSYL